jgi:predicted nucleic acid-binding protein
MAKIVADADGLIKMGKSGALGRLLRAAEVLVPERVYQEAVVAGKRGLYEDALELERVLAEGPAEVVAEITADETLGERAGVLLEAASSLGAGEREALRLFLARRADAVLTDDRAFANLLAREGIGVLVPAAAIVALAEGGRMSVGEAEVALRRMEPLVRREAYEAAMQDLARVVQRVPEEGNG